MDVTIGTDPIRFPIMHSYLERHSWSRYIDRPPKEGYIYYVWTS